MAEFSLWAAAQLFGAVFLFLGNHKFFGFILSISCFFSFLFAEGFTSRQESADFIVGEKTITIESHRITSPDGGCTYFIYEPIIKDVVAKEQYSFFASLPSIPFSEFVTIKETEIGYSIIFSDDRYSLRLIVSYDYETGEWTETKERTEENTQN